MASSSVTRVLELYSGIGGMHFALLESGIKFKVVAAIDINPVANQIYTHNFPDCKLLEAGIETLTPSWLDNLQLDMILMSPPCQPFTRIGKKRDCADGRTSSFLHILDCLPKLNHRPSCILLENVKGFEISEARERLVSTLEKCNYQYQEFLLTPLQFGIPNSRCRYYLLAKKRPEKFAFETKDSLHEDIPHSASQWLVHKENDPPDWKSMELSEDLASFLNSWKTYGQIMHQAEDEEGHIYTGCKSLSGFLENESEEYFKEYLIPDKLLNLFIIIDIVSPFQCKSVCFTKRYGHFIQGAGSAVQMAFDSQALKDAYHLKKKTVELKNRHEWKDEELSIIRKLKLRFFTPREISNLLCFPQSFIFPKEITTRQKYRVLGNSLNVHVVSILIRLLLMTSSTRDADS